jgi:hypothetical protein
LDEDDVEFLDSVLESTRKQEAEVKRRTREDLEAFKRQQQEAEQAAKVTVEPEAPVATDSWAVSRKRKKGKEDVLGGVKLRKSSSGAKAVGEAAKTETLVSPSAASAVETQAESAASIKPSASKDVTADSIEAKAPPATATKPSASPSSPPGSGLGLVAYSSDEDD